MVELNRKTRARPVIDSQINSESSSNTQQNGSGASMNGDKPKKFIQPTIPVNRTKFQQEAPAEQKPIRIGGEGRDHQSSGRRKGQDRPKIVKFTGTLFGQGPSALHNKVGGSHKKRESSSSSANNLEKAKIISTVSKVEKVEEGETLRMLIMRDNFVDTNYENVLVQPTLLPKSKLEVDVDIKIEVDLDVVLLLGGIKIKQREMEVDSIPGSKTVQSYEHRGNQTLVKEVFEKEGDIVIMQLPDACPNFKTAKERLPAIKPAPGVDEEQADNRTSEEAPIAPENIFEDIPEGRMGSLRIHESRKMSLQLGELGFVLGAATQVSF